ncbi:MAG: Na+/H+ antiporter subunit E [Alphaproteobacteria bacterium]
MSDLHSNPTGAIGGRAAQAVTIALLGAAAWAALTRGDPASLVIGAPTVALAVYASLTAHVPPPQRPAALARFALFLIEEVFASAWYVASQVFRARMRLDPGLVTYRMRLRSGSARATFMIAVAVTPGTLPADQRKDRLIVHALDRRADVHGALRNLEGHIAPLFAEPREDRT